MILRILTPALIFLAMGVPAISGGSPIAHREGAPAPPAIAPAPRSVMPLPRFITVAGAHLGGGEAGDTLYGPVLAVDDGSITVAALPRPMEEWDEKGKFVRAWVVPAQPPRTFQAIGFLGRVD